MDQPPPLAAPPTLPGAMVRAKPASRWPTAIGIIAIVFGVLGILGGIWGVFGTLLSSQFTIGVGPQRQMFEVMRYWMMWNVVASAISGGVGIFLLIAGIMLMQRKAAARRACLAWAVTKIIVALGTSTIYYLYQQDLFAATAQMQPAAPGGVGMMMNVMAGVMSVLYLLWGWGLPVFILIWLSRRKIKAEIAKW